MAASATTQSTDSAAHAGPQKPAPSAPLHTRETGPELKRKATDQNLEITTIDPHYDLTLIVGSPNHEHGQMAFRVNRGSMRNVSDVWTKMLTGDWTELRQSEIEMPEDSWKALLLVLRMAHFQSARLPDRLSAEDLLSLAVLTDKYNLGMVVRDMLKLKKWLLPYKAEWTKRLSHSYIQEFAQMTMAFGLDEDFEYLVTRLAVEVRVHEKTKRFILDSGKEQVHLRSTLSDRILSKSTGANSFTQSPTGTTTTDKMPTARIDTVRTAMLSELIFHCDAEADVFLYAIPGSDCSKLCDYMRCGILMKGLHAAGFKHHLNEPSTMYRSVASYWKALQSIGGPTTFGSGRDAQDFVCEDRNYCGSDFGVCQDLGESLKELVPKEVFALLERVR